VHGALRVDERHPAALPLPGRRSALRLGYEANWLWALGFLEDGPAGSTASAPRIASYGYNHVFVNAYAHDTRWAPGKTHPEDYGPPPEYAWAGTNDEPDHLHLNPRYGVRSTSWPTPSSGTA
jgi:hypothetical protein